MFCFQCEQAAKGTGCDKAGVCGKQPQAASLQDLIVYQLKGIGFLANSLRTKGIKVSDADQYTVEALFTTVTNVNFDSESLSAVIRQGGTMREQLLTLYKEHVDSDLSSVPESARFTLANTDVELMSQGAEHGIPSTHHNEDIRSVQQLLTYGLKGMAAYADHAQILGKTDDSIFAFFHEALSYLNEKEPELENLVALNMKCGEVNIKAMEILDEAHTTRYGHPEPTSVSTSWKKGPAIVVTGHDLLDLEELLKQTEGTGVNVYTHGEMLPAHGYPELRKYKHLAGHFGTAWQNQQKEFDGVPAAFLFTTNCIQKPLAGYADQVFTTGLVAWPNIKHVGKHDFKQIIEKAKSLGGLPEKEGHSLMTGFGRNAVLGVADKVIEGVKGGDIRHFFLVGGCDGAKPGRNYYTDLAQEIPKDCVILTLACGKFRFNHLDFGTIGGIPRLLDVGQCNDAYSAVKIAQALAEAFGVGVNELPLSLILSWYEQKAVVILLSLLALGIKGIRIGPSLPAFITPNILNFLVEQFNIKPISTVEEDLSAILA
ncbi:hydroxylamine reductase [Chitinispirillales bacterium ANBcel5]|uniref:hydroxylamine reductase n=1 Tax=Cellulosispirillum alkaliphilum TaxID=3039283 RepID=UPI002A4ECD13|nr:hydroxylamine reductase [Chitinispirillales bacterium ANBcel5]